VAKLSGTDGHALWSGAFGDVADQYVSAVGVDSAGNSLITGPEHGSVNFGGMPLVGAGFYVARFSPSGAHSWSRQWGPSNGSAAASSIAVDANGGPILAGAYGTSSLDFGQGALPAPPSNASGVFVLRLDAAGAASWSRGFVPSAGSGAFGATVAIDGTGAIVLGGAFAHDIAFDGPPLVTGGLWQASFLARLDQKSGAATWSRALGSGGPNDFANPAALAVGPSGGVVMLGQFEGVVDLGAGALTPSDVGSTDDFLLTLAP
jgi:hypothetical protein